MRKLDGEFENFYPHNSARLGDRLFRFLRSGSSLLVTELTLGEEVTKTEVDTGVDTGITQRYFPGCCRLGDRALVMFGAKNAASVFAALVSVGPGELSRESIQVERLEVKGPEVWTEVPFLAQIGENKVWASFLNSDEAWICEVKGSAIEWTKSAAKLPAAGGFGAIPLRLPGGRFLAAGTGPLSTDIYIVIPGDDPSFEKIGELQGTGRYSVSTVLLGERFVVGLGGWAGGPTDEMWVFDLETRRSSPIAKQGDWHPAAWWSVLEARSGALYTIGGADSTSARLVPLVSLFSLVQDRGIRASLFRCEGALRVPWRKPSTQGRGPSAAHFLRAFVGDPSSASALLSPELAALLASEWEEEVSIERKLGSQRNLELWAAREEISALKAEIECLRAEVERVTPPPGTVQLRLPFKDLPPLRLPQKWRINQKKLADMNTAMEVHRSALPRGQAALRGYQRAFEPLLGEGLPRKLLSASASVPGGAARDAAASQASASLRPGDLFPPAAGLPPWPGGAPSAQRTSSWTRRRPLVLGEAEEGGGGGSGAEGRGGGRGSRGAGSRSPHAPEGQEGQGPGVQRDGGGPRGAGCSLVIPAPRNGGSEPLPPGGPRPPPFPCRGVHHPLPSPFLPRPSGSTFPRRPARGPSRGGGGLCDRGHVAGGE